MMEIINHDQLKALLLNEDEPLVFYLYTPLCGTCKLAKEYLKIIGEMDNAPIIYELDINLFKEQSKQWGIQSVPCLIHISKGIESKLYAFESVTKVYEFIIEKNRR